MDVRTQRLKKFTETFLLTFALELATESTPVKGHNVCTIAAAMCNTWLGELSL